MPNFPLEVIEMWLRPFAETQGWPPSEQKWKDLLPITRSLEFWRNTKWEKQLVDIVATKYSYFEASKRRAMIGGFIKPDKKNDYSKMIFLSGGNFKATLEKMLKTGLFSRPPIFFKEQNLATTVVDGAHRLLAFDIAWDVYYSLDKKDREKWARDFSLTAIHEPNKNQEVWICSPNWAFPA